MPNPPSQAQQMQQIQQLYARSSSRDLRGHFDKIGEAQATLSVTRTALDRLLEQGEAVSMDDVVREAAHLVSHGVDPRGVATMLASMPENGPGISQWLQQQASVLAKHEAQMSQGRNVLRQMALQKAIQEMQTQGPGLQAPQEGAGADAGAGGAGGPAPAPDPMAGAGAAGALAPSGG